jgi:uncharacterized protein HemX
MKFTARLAAFIAMAVFAVAAFAADNFKDIQSQMMSRNWGQAEQMLKSYLDQKPNSAKANYLLAQVYEQNRKYDLAQKYLDKANGIDPSQRFASPGQANNMASRLAVKTATSSKQYARTDKPATTYREPSYTPPTYHAPAPRVATQTQPAVVTSQAPAQQSGGGAALLFVLLALVVLGGVGYFIFTQRAKKQVLEQLNAERRALLAQSVKQQERVAELRKKLMYENQATSDLASDVNGLSSEINNMATNLRVEVAADDYPITTRRTQVESMERRLTDCEGRLNRKAFNIPAPAPAPRTPNATTQDAMREADEMIARRAEPRYEAPRPTYTPPPAPAPVQQTVVHEHHHHDSGPDLLSTVVLANAMSHNHNDGYAERALREERERNARLERELEREREEDRRQAEREREEARREERQRERERQEERAEEERRERERSYSAPVMDFGGRDEEPAQTFDFGGSDNSSSSNDSPALDFGGSDDDDRDD